MPRRRVEPVGADQGTHTRVPTPEGFFLPMCDETDPNWMCQCGLPVQYPVGLTTYHPKRTKRSEIDKVSALLNRERVRARRVRG